MTSYSEKSVTLKIVYNKKNIQILVINMPFISSQRKKYFSFLPLLLMKYAFFASLDEKNGIFKTKKRISSIYRTGICFQVQLHARKKKYTRVFHLIVALGFCKVHYESYLDFIHSSLLMCSPLTEIQFRALKSGL